jgi:hypothetical protein
MQELAQGLFRVPPRMYERANQRLPDIRRLLLVQGRFDRGCGLRVFDL